MYYKFIINGRTEKSGILPDLLKQIENLDRKIEYDTYVCTGVGDATRYVRICCEFSERKDICFVACGGSGTANEVATALIAHPGFCMAMMNYGATNDLSKYFAGRDFHSLAALLDAEPMLIDAIKCNDDYAINVINMGFDSMVAINVNDHLESGHTKNGYLLGFLESLLKNRFNRMSVYVDGKKISRWASTLCTVSNARYCGGMFKCSPEALVDDGLLDVCCIRGLLFWEFFLFIPKYIKGTFLGSRFCRRRLEYVRGTHVEVIPKNLMYISLDGEISASRKFVIDILPKAVSFMVPATTKQ